MGRDAIAFHSTLARLPLHQAPLQPDNHAIEQQDACGQYHDTGKNGIDFKDALGLQDQVTHTLSGPQVLTPTSAPTKASPTDLCKLEKTQAMALGR